MSACRLFLAAVLLGLGTQSALAALPSSLAWEVRSTGSDNNGGGFDPSVASPGTDYSQQDTAQIAYTDLVIGATTTQFTSSAHPVTSAIVGDTIQIISGAGCTTGFYNIRSQASSIATTDRSLGTAASTCTANLGGGLATPKKAVDSHVAGNQIYVQCPGTYTQTATITVASESFYSSTTIPTAIRGYKTSHGDRGASSCRPLLTTATNSTPLFNLASSLGLTFDSVQLSNTAATRAVGIEANNSSNDDLLFLYNVSMDGFTQFLYGDFGVPFTLTVTAVFSEFKNQSGNLSGIQVNGGYFYRDYFHGNGTGAVIEYVRNSGDMNPLVVDHSIFASNGIAIQSDANTADYRDRLRIVFSDFDSNTDAIKFPNGSSYIDAEIDCNAFTNQTGWAVNGVNSGQPPAMLAHYNAFYNNTSGTWRNMSATSGAAASIGDITLTANPWTSGSDFTPNSTAGGGAALKNACSFGALGGTDYAYVGAIAPQASAGSSAANPQMFLSIH